MADVRLMVQGREGKDGGNQYARQGGLATEFVPV
jgi:hypothetical protein